MSSFFEVTTPVNDEWLEDNTGRRRISGQGVMLFLYSVIVSFALILVVSKNFETPEQILAEEQLAEEGKRVNEEKIAANNMTLPEVYVDENVTEIESFDNPTVEWTVQGEENQPEVKDEVLIVEKGDHFIGILQRLGMEYNEASQITSALKKVGYDVRSLQAGQKINITKTVDVPFGELLSVDKIVIEPSASVKYIVTRNEDEKYVAEAEQQELKNENKTISGTIRNSLAATMRNAGVPQSVVSNFANIFTYKVNFRSDIKAGDTFRVMYDRKMAPDGRVVKNGNILYAELNLGRRNKITLYRYKDASGNVDYYDEKGMALKRALVRKPLEFSSARVSSHFGWRRHPILKQRILHSGVDYAAPMGSRIYASGDGVIQRAQWAQGYGRYVVIRHNSEYSTGYAHMSGFARGIKPGVRVKQGQVIGYVGSTGRSTGPHLHFEIMKNGKKVDPLKIKAATGANLAGADLRKFKQEVSRIVAMVEKDSKLASK
ncbi:MAG: M23 family metallopeptidase [Alphaproteobacteria bacterium]|nr:M23 family metallopeptidase [Alphaproteobacteria bacterium]